MGCSFSAARQAKKEADKEEKALKSRPEEQSGDENVLFEKPVGPEEKDAGIGTVSGDVEIKEEKTDSSEQLDLAGKMPVVFDLGGNLLGGDQTGFIAEQEKKAESEMLDLANQLESQASETSNTAGDAWNKGVEGISGGVTDLQSGAEGTVVEGTDCLTDTVGAMKSTGKSAATTGTDFVSVELEAAGDKAEAFAKEGKEHLSTEVTDMETKAEGFVDQTKENILTEVGSAKTTAESFVNEERDKLSSQAAAAKDEIAATAQSIVSESTELALSKARAAQDQAGNLVQEGQDQVSTEISGLQSNVENVLSEGTDLVSDGKEYVSSEVGAAQSTAVDLAGDAQDQMSSRVTAAKDTVDTSINQGTEHVYSEVDQVRNLGESTVEQGQQGLGKEVQSTDETFESLMAEGGQFMSGGFEKLTFGADSAVNQSCDEFAAKAAVAEDSATTAAGHTGEQFGNVEDFVSNVIHQSVEQVSAETIDTAQKAEGDSVGAVDGAKSTAGTLLGQGSEFISAQTGEIREKVEDLVNQGKEYISQGLGQAGQAVSSATSQGAGNIFNFDNVGGDDAKTGDEEASTTTEEFSKQIVESVLAGAMATLKGTPPPQNEGTSVDGDITTTQSDPISPGSSVDAPSGDTNLIDQGREFVQNQRDKILSEISDQDSIGASLISFGMSNDPTTETGGPSTESFDSSYSSELSRELGLDNTSASSTTPSDARTFTPDAIDLSSPETLEGPIIPSELPSAVKDELQKQVEPIVQALPSDVSSLTDVSSSLPDMLEFGSTETSSVESIEPCLMAGSLESSLVSTIPTEEEWRKEAERKMTEIGKIGAEQSSKLVESLQPIKDNAQVSQDSRQLNLPLRDENSPDESSGDTTPTGPCGTALGCPGDPGHVDTMPETGHDPAVHGAKLEDRFYNNDSFKNSSVDPSNPRQQDAALSIQTQYRQHAAKEEVAKMQQETAAPAATDKKEEEEIDIDLNDPEVADAATKIQAGFRGYKARKEVHDIKDDEEDPDNEIIDIDLTDPETELAAVKIQAAFRKHQKHSTDHAKIEEASSAPEDVDTKVEEAPSAPEGEAVSTDPEPGKSEEPVTEATAEPRVEDEIDLTDPEVIEATKKIQASFNRHKKKKAPKDS